MRSLSILTRTVTNKSCVPRFTGGNVSRRTFCNPKPGVKAFVLNPRDHWKGNAFKVDTVEGKAVLNEIYTSFGKGYDALEKTYGKEIAVKLEQYRNRDYSAIADYGPPIKVAITGVAGSIGYALVWRIASGGLFGPTVPISLHLLEIPGALQRVQGMVMELRDSAFPVLKDIVVSDNPEKAFDGVDYALLVGAQPRAAGMERGDLLLKNAEIFAIQGKALNKHSKGKDTRVVVVGNPANTNALIARHNAPNIPPENFSAMTRLDHNRGLAQLSLKTGQPLSDIDNFAIWGNHSATQFPDVSYTTIGGKPAIDLIGEQWYESTFIPTVQKRGAEIIAARGSSSAASAASALVDAVKDIHFGTGGQWTSAAIASKGEYGITKGLYFSYPVIYLNKKAHIVPDLVISEKSREKLKVTEKELIQERDAVAKFLPN